MVVWYKRIDDIIEELEEYIKLKEEKNVDEFELQKMFDNILSSLEGVYVRQSREILRPKGQMIVEKMQAFFKSKEFIEDTVDNIFTYALNNIEKGMDVNTAIADAFRTYESRLSQKISTYLERTAKTIK